MTCSGEPQTGSYNAGWDVGADRIARTAHAALQLLQELRAITRRPIPLAWVPRFKDVAAIEVYPAATLTAYRIQASGYKRADQASARVEMIEALRDHLRLPADVSPMRERADVLDAAVCVLAAADFMNDRVVYPEDDVLAAQEGWIWFRPRQET